MDKKMMRNRSETQSHDEGSSNYWSRIYSTKEKEVLLSQRRSHLQEQKRNHADHIRHFNCSKDRHLFLDRLDENFLHRSPGSNNSRDKLVYFFIWFNLRHYKIRTEKLISLKNLSNETKFCCNFGWIRESPYQRVNNDDSWIDRKSNTREIVAIRRRKRFRRFTSRSSLRSFLRGKEGREGREKGIKSKQ